MWKKAGLGLEEAVMMMSANPAAVLGLGDRKGLLKKGYDADIVVFDDNVDIVHAMVGGELRF